MEQSEHCPDLLSDGEIVSLFLARDERAITETDRRYRGLLISVAQNILRDRGESEECLNDTYAAAWNAIPPANPDVLRSFLVTILRRSAINRLRAEARQKRFALKIAEPLHELEDILTGGDDPEQEVDEAMLGKIISDYVRKLPERQRTVFISRFYLSKPIGEIGKELGCSISTVKREIKAIQISLKERLESEGYTL